jgi:hypothetical protein
MDLLAKLAQLEEEQGNTGIACSAGKFLDSVSDKEREAFNAVLDKRSVAISNLCDLLQKNGHNVAESALYKHRNKKCRCFK